MITSEKSKSSVYVSDGVTRKYDYGFKVMDTAHAVVYRDGEEVPAAGNFSRGGSFSPSSPVGDGRIEFFADKVPPAGAKILIVRTVPAQQTVSLQDNEAFLPKVIEGALDKLTMLIQQLREVLSRVPTAPPDETATPEELYDRFINAADELQEAVDTIDTRVGNYVSSHNLSAYAHPAIQSKIDSDIDAHNGMGDAHPAIQSKIDSDIDAHDEDEDAHPHMHPGIDDLVRLLNGVLDGDKLDNPEAFTPLWYLIAAIIAHNGMGDAHADIRALVGSGGVASDDCIRMVLAFS